MRVLVADDDRDFAAALSGLVRACDHEVVDTVTKGGLSVIQSYAQHQPDVVLLDIMQPRLNGSPSAGRCSAAIRKQRSSDLRLWRDDAPIGRPMWSGWLPPKATPFQRAARSSRGRCRLGAASFLS
jgi:PleD family two-component response regulator